MQLESQQASHASACPLMSRMRIAMQHHRLITKASAHARRVHKRTKKAIANIHPLSSFTTRNQSQSTIPKTTMT
eukprot:856899-Amphidinium_carterae.1